MNLLKKQSDLIKRQYARPKLFDDIIARLVQKKIDVNQLKRSDISALDEFHIRGAEVSYELVRNINLRNLRVLDVGCGLGGPSRMLADNYNCDVFGIDLNPEYIDTASRLSGLIRGNGSTEFIVGDAQNLPFKDGSFDAVWTQHVQMNIDDKDRFYSEIHRVLKKKGAFIYYDIFKSGPNEISYPVPWANNNNVSFLQTKENMDEILKGLGFLNFHSTDQTIKAIDFLKTLLEKQINESSIGLNILLGDSTKEKFNNVYKALESGNIELYSGIYKKY